MLNNDFFLIVNANASKGKARQRYEHISKFFKDNGHNVTTSLTQGPGHAMLLAKKAAENGFKTIIAIGGDGTVNEVANGIMLSKKNGEVNMGIIPIGRGNDFAWSAKIPRDITKACNLILTKNVKKIDVGFVKSGDAPEGRYFLNGAGFGFEPMVNFRAMEYKHLNGMPSYIVAFLYILKNTPKPYELKITIDDNEPINVNTQQLSVANGVRMGSAFKMAPLASIDDGKFDVMYTKHPLKGFELLKMVKVFLSGKHINDQENFGYINANKIIVESAENNVQSHIDGEILTKNGRIFELEILPGAINLIRP